MSQAARLKILSIIDSLGTGGAEHHLANLCRQLKDGPFILDVFALHNKNDFYAERMAATGTRVSFGGSSRYDIIRIVVNLIRTLQTGQYDILHAYLEGSTYLGAFLGRLLKVPVVITTVCARKDHFGAWPFDFTLYKRLSRFIDYYITAIPAELIGLGIQKKQIYFSTFCIDGPQQTSPYLKTETKNMPFPDIKNAFPVILGIGRLHPDKGFHFAIKALVHVLKVYPNAMLLILGKGREQSHLNKLAVHLGVVGHVIFCGVHRNLAPFFKAATVYVNTSVNEGVNLSHLGALAHGVATVKFKTPVNVDASFGCFNFFSTAALRDSESLAHEVIKICKDKTYKQRLVEKGQEYYSRYMDADAVGQYESLYLKVWNERQIV